MLYSKFYFGRRRNQDQTAFYVSHSHVLDVPDRVQSVILEYADPQGPWGARGMAEMPYLPYAPAVTAAVHAAIGVWIDEFPLTPARVLAALHAAV
ncbi:hypothetical protein EMGBS1_01970 [Chloroflexota bacterium]|nr:hypothetical protein EMGBS1_01970 [Chloroflexota bacterium]